MRTRLFASAALLSVGAFCSPAYAGDTAGLGPNDEVIPVVAPGEQIGVACDALDVAQQGDVRVVLTVSAKPGDKELGFSKVLATDQTVASGAVRVKVPKLPDIANHTYDLTVYVSGTKGDQVCDAGHVKVAEHLSALTASQHTGS